MTLATCDLCGGSGEVIRFPCEVCAGRGSIKGTRTVPVEIPGGVSDGTRLRLSRQGEPGPPGTRPGDLYVEIRVESDPRFSRDGDDLIVRLPLGFAQATLGTEVEIPLLEGGSLTLEVPAGTQPGAVFPVRGKGVQRLGRRGRGDILVEVAVEVPQTLSRDQEEALRRYAELRGEDTARPSRRRMTR